MLFYDIACEKRVRNLTSRNGDCHMNNYRMKSIAIALLAIAVTGCESTGPSSKNFSYVRLPGVDKESAFTAATKAMREGHDIARIDRDQWMIQSVPEETEEEATTPRVGDLVGVPRNVRRVATAYVTGTTGATEAWCKIVIERNESREHNLFKNDMQQDDTASATPAERDAATTTEQNSVWRMLRRDKRAEREFLNTVREMTTAQSK